MKTISNQILINYIKVIILNIIKSILEIKIIKLNSENKIKIQKYVEIVEKKVTILLNSRYKKNNEDNHKKNNNKD